MIYLWGIIYKTTPISHAMKKATIATVKSFIRKNADNLFINVTSRFDGMADGCTDVNDGFKKVSISHEINQKYTFGVPGAWFVGSSRDYIQNYESDLHAGFTISNSCGRFTIAVSK